jgi:hypothetical protein
VVSNQRQPKDKTPQTPVPHPSAQLKYTVLCPKCGTPLKRIRDLDSSSTQSSRHVCAIQPTLL